MQVLVLVLGLVVIFRANLRYNCLRLKPTTLGDLEQWAKKKGLTILFFWPISTSNYFFQFKGSLFYTQVIYGNPRISFLKENVGVDASWQCEALLRIHKFNLKIGWRGPGEWGRNNFKIWICFLNSLIVYLAPPDCHLIWVVFYQWALSSFLLIVLDYFFAHSWAVW